MGDCPLHDLQSSLFFISGQFVSALLATPRVRDYFGQFADDDEVWGGDLVIVAEAIRLAAVSPSFELLPQPLTPEIREGQEPVAFPALLHPR